MAMYDNLYSRLVAGMKIVLPLAALGIMATLFLVSRTIDPVDAIPFADPDLRDRAGDQGVTRPTFSGVTDGGDQIRFSAKSARPAPDNPLEFYADSVTARLRLLGGTVVDISSSSALIDQSRNEATLTGDVHIVTTDGYDIRTDTLLSRFTTLHAETAGPITGFGPPGTIEAGKMVLSSDENGAHAQLLFTDGVKLVYTPRTPQE